MRIILLGILGLAIGGACLLWTFDTMSDIRASAAWPTAQGVVTSSRVERKETRTRGGGYNAHYDADVAYRYAVGGRSYESSTFVFGVSHSFPDSAAAQAEVDAYPPGRPVRVFYDPRDPARACVTPGVVPSGFDLLVWTSGVFVLFGAALVVLGVRQRRAGRRARLAAPPSPVQRRHA